jgi:hypothetical protein
MNGKMLITTTLDEYDHSKDLDISQIASGTYLLQIRSGQKAYSGKFIKQ